MTRPEIVDELIAFAGIPSVSTDPAYASHVTEAADWLAERLKRAGLDAVIVHQTPGHPIVTAQWLRAESAPTVLVYGHYDVQPPDPVESWKSPPFEPQLRDGRIYGRGVSDDKGPLLIAIKAAEACLHGSGRLPVNLKFVIEGEEECGSPNLEAFIKMHAGELGADLVLSADGAMWRPDEPSITVANRGLAALEFTVTGAAKDLHSGRHGGGIANPLHAIAALVASLHDADNRIAVEGFYDAVKPADDAARRMIGALPFDEERYLRSIGAREGVGEKGYCLLERQWLRPTLDVNGLWGGYQGPGGKTVIARSASAKITCRLVPDQEPQTIVRLISRHLQRNCPAGVALDIRADGHGSKAYEVPGDHPGLAIAERALQEIYGKPALRVRMGATIPIGLIFREALGAETIFFSFSTADEDYHAPNEFFRLSRLDEGVRAWLRYWELLGAERA
ncbi:dipeptidase [Taklimakanibacter deserti]|uniref:dipeptidase n=1 Tax=Taklimakanibacter deserti TaxID=2267839 RepID=UPI000E65BCCD